MPGEAPEPGTSSQPLQSRACIGWLCTGLPPQARNAITGTGQRSRAGNMHNWSVCAQVSVAVLLTPCGNNRRYVRIATNQLQFPGCICYRHQPAAQSQRGSPARSRRRRRRPADALPARSLPGGRICHGGGSPPGRDWLVPARNKTAARSLGSRLAPQRQKGRYSYSDFRPTATPTPDLRLAVRFMVRANLDAPRSQTVPNALSDCQRPQFSPGGPIFRGPAPARPKDIPPRGSRPRTGAATARAI